MTNAAPKLHCNATDNSHRKFDALASQQSQQQNFCTYRGRMPGDECQETNVRGRLARLNTIVKPTERLSYVTNTIPNEIATAKY